MSEEFIVFRKDRSDPLLDDPHTYNLWCVDRVDNVKVLHGDELAYYMTLKENVQQLYEKDKLGYGELYTTEQELIDTAFLLFGMERDAH